MIIIIKRETEAQRSDRVTRARARVIQSVWNRCWGKPWGTMETEGMEPKDTQGMFAAAGEGNTCKYPPREGGETHHAPVRPRKVLGAEPELGGFHVRRESRAPRRIYWMTPSQKVKPRPEDPMGGGE